MTTDGDRNPFIPFMSSNPLQRRICSHGLRQAACTSVVCKIELCELNHKAYEKKFGVQPTMSPPTWSPPNGNP